MAKKLNVALETKGLKPKKMHFSSNASQSSINKSKSSKTKSANKKQREQ